MPLTYLKEASTKLGWRTWKKLHSLESLLIVNDGGRRVNDTPRRVGHLQAPGSGPSPRNVWQLFQADPSSTNQREARAGSANQRPGIESGDRAGQWESTLTASRGRRVRRWWWPHRKSRWLTSRVTRINALFDQNNRNWNQAHRQSLWKTSFYVISATIGAPIANVCSNSSDHLDNRLLNFKWKYRYRS